MLKAFCSKSIENTFKGMYCHPIQYLYMMCTSIPMLMVKSGQLMVSPIRLHKFSIAMVNMLMVTLYFNL